MSKSDWGILLTILTIMLVFIIATLPWGEGVITYEPVQKEPIISEVSAHEIEVESEVEVIEAETCIEEQTEVEEETTEPATTEVIELPITIVRHEEPVVEVEPSDEIVFDEEALAVSEEVVTENPYESLEMVVEETYFDEEEVFEEEVSEDENFAQEDVQESFEIPAVNNYGGEFNKEEGIFIHDDGTVYRVKEMMVVFSTAYHIQGCGKAPDHPEYGLAASGFSMREYVEAGINPRVIAVDPNLIPLGTKVYVEVPESSKDMYISDDYGFASAEDTGGAIKGAKIDVLQLDYQAAVEWGVRYVNLYILEPI